MAILIVDDESDTRRLLALILKNAGYPESEAATSAADAFRKLGLGQPAGQVPPSLAGETPSSPALADPPLIDLILMDVTMQPVDGIEACRRIKSDPRLQDIPIIMVTGRGEPESLKAAFDAGAADYVTKPLNRVELLARVRSALKLKFEMDRRKAREQELLQVTAQLEEANQRLDLLSRLDGLTAIANRRQFDLTLEHEWRRALRTGTHLALILVDIDHFKRYNDTYGHQAGDDCLRRVATVLSGVTRRPPDLAARYGGEEFAVILPETNAAAAANLAELLRVQVEDLQDPQASSDVSPFVTISLGVAAAPPSPGITPADLIAAADRALYQSKRNGRNRVSVSSFCLEGLEV